MARKNRTVERHQPPDSGAVLNWLLTVSGGVAVLLLTGSFYYTYSADRDQTAEKREWRQAYGEEVKGEIKEMKANQARIETQQHRIEKEVTEKSTEIKTKLDLLLDLQRERAKGR